MSSLVELFLCICSIVVELLADFESLSVQVLAIVSSRDVTKFASDMVVTLNDFF